MLTELRCRSAPPKDKSYKLADARGLYLFVTPTGYKSWRWKYLFDGAEKRLTFGPYPEVSLAEARDLRDGAARLKRQGLDPGEHRKKAAAQRAAQEENTVEKVARAWHAKKRATWSPGHAGKVLKSLEDEVFGKRSSRGLWQGEFGLLPIAAVTAPMLLELLQPIEDRGAVDQAHRVRQRMSDVFVFGIAAGMASNDPAGNLKKAMTPNRKRNYPAFVKLEDARMVLRLTEGAPAHPLTKLASRLMAITAARSWPLRHAVPAEFEGLESAEPIWRIPPGKMKLDLQLKELEAFEFIIPLPWQAVAVVKAALSLVGEDAPLLFPSTRHVHRPMSENAISSMYKRFPAIVGRHVPHGWRSTFSTIMNERAVDLDRPEDRPIIDLMLAHKPAGVEAAYNRAAYMPRRRQLAQEWADMLLEGLPPAGELLKGPRN